MNLSYLGDALDHWKGSLFEFLQARQLLHGLTVDPMATDVEAWRERDYSLFADLLRVPRARIIRHRAKLATRREYFAEIRHKGDVFLDPDTGVATSRGRSPEKYVQPSDVWSLLANGGDRLVVVYQHVRAAAVTARVDRVLVHLVGSKNLGWCSYESGTVAMLHLSLAPRRTRAIATAFNAWLGRHAERRIRHGVLSRSHCAT